MVYINCHYEKLPETNSEFTPENRLGPKRKRSYSNHPFSGAFAVSFREGTGENANPRYFENIFWGCETSQRQNPKLNLPFTFSHLWAEELGSFGLASQACTPLKFNILNPKNEGWKMLGDFESPNMGFNYWGSDIFPFQMGDFQVGPPG